MKIRKFKRSFSRHVAGSMGGDISVDYCFEISQGEYSLCMQGIREDYGGETSFGGSGELHSVSGYDAEDFVQNFSRMEADMMISYDGLLDELAQTKRGGHVAENLSDAANNMGLWTTGKISFKEQFPEEYRRQQLKNWDENALVHLLKEQEYSLPDEPLEVWELRPILMRGIERATLRKETSALKALLEIGSEDELLPAHAFKSAGEAEDFTAVMDLIEIYGPGSDLKVAYHAYYYVEISNPFKILFETGFQAGTILVYRQGIRIENRLTRKRGESSNQCYDGLTIADWIGRAKERGMKTLADLLECSQYEGKQIP